MSRRFMPNDSIPNCVPDWFLEQQERAEQEYEREKKDKEYYEKCRRNLSEAEEKGYPVLKFGGYPECRDCQHKNNGTMRSADDDFCLVICQNPACPCHGKYKDTEEDLLW